MYTYTNKYIYRKKSVQYIQVINQISSIRINLAFLVRRMAYTQSQVQLRIQCLECV